MKSLQKEIAVLFLKLGTIAFGGPAAHIAMMEDEVVKRRKWLTHERFLDLLGVTNLIPGPNSTEMAIHIGYLKAGWIGLIIAGICFIIPAVVITLFFAYLYKIYGTMPQVEVLTIGIRSAILAVIISAIVRLGTPHAKNVWMVVLGLTVTILNLFHIDELALLFGAGLFGIFWKSRNDVKKKLVSFFSTAFITSSVLMFAGGVTKIDPESATVSGLGLFFLKIGSILYGSGYVLVAFLQGGLVDGKHWLTQTQLMDAIAIGQFTPGPVLSTATFIGYLILGVPGAVVATIGIFLPSFIFVRIVSPFISQLRNSRLASGFLDGINAAALGLMLSVCIMLGRSVLTGFIPWLIFILAGIVLIKWKIHPAWIIISASILGWLLLR